MKTFGAGSEVDAWCTRCRMDLLHRVIALSESRPMRVVCQTCGSQHNYRAPRVGSAPAKREGAATKSKPPRGPRGEQRRLADWEARVRGHGSEVFARYSIEKTFSLGELVLHKKFGEGYVTEVLEDRKVCVMFRDGPRTLSHGAE
jgi:hypothetical protein